MNLLSHISYRDEIIVTMSVMYSKRFNFNLATDLQNCEIQKTSFILYKVIIYTNDD